MTSISYDFCPVLSFSENCAFVFLKFCRLDSHDSSDKTVLHFGGLQDADRFHQSVEVADYCGCNNIYPATFKTVRNEFLQRLYYCQEVKDICFDHLFGLFKLG